MTVLLQVTSPDKPPRGCPSLGSGPEARPLSTSASEVDLDSRALQQLLKRLWRVRTTRVQRTYMIPSPTPCHRVDGVPAVGLFNFPVYNYKFNRLALAFSSPASQNPMSWTFQAINRSIGQSLYPGDSMTSFQSGRIMGPCRLL